MSNELSNDLSPYLQQHKKNPVFWKTWSKETLRLAKENKKPILLNKSSKTRLLLNIQLILVETGIKFLSLKEELFLQTQMILLPILVRIIFCLMPQCNITKLTI